MQLAAAGPEAGADAVGQAAFSLDEEERELWRQLRRKRDFEGRVAEKRTQLADLQERRRAVSSSLAEAAASVEHLADELNFVRQQEREIEHDIAMLKESNRILQQAFQSRQAAPAVGGASPQAGLEPRDALAEERARRESVQAQHEQIGHLRAHLERVRAEKAALQQRQQALFDRQRAAEQDRNRLIGSLQDDRSGINELRGERIRLWEERASMEREMARILREVQLNGGDVAVEAPRQPTPGAAAGVRGHVSRDTPSAFFTGGRAEPAASPLWEEEEGAPPLAEAPPARPHWTGFADGGPEVGGSAGGSLVFPGLTAPPSFGQLGSGPGGGAGGRGAENLGVTDWSGAMRDFKATTSVGSDRFL